MFSRIFRLLLGLTLYGIAIAMMLRAEIGVSPWDVLAQGLSLKTGWGFGAITVVVGVVVLLAWIPLRERPGAGTILNVVLVGPAADLGLWVIPAGLPLWLRVMLFAAGLALLAAATGVYIGAGFGPGPRDGLMTGIRTRLGWPLWVGRTLVEGTVLGMGWMLGGDVGIGTVLFAALVGPLCNATIPLFASRPRTAGVPAPEGAGAPEARSATRA
ncbi:membrane protein [Okibacterium endophyticum]